MVPKMFSQVAQNAELLGSKFIMLRQNPSIPITTFRACFVSWKIIEQIYYSFIGLVSLVIQG